MQILRLIILLMFCNMAQSEEILVWPTKAEMEEIKKIEWKELEKHGFYEHPCGHVKTASVTALPPPDSPRYIEGTEKVYEFDPDGAVINQWAMPVDSYLFAVSGKSIIVRKGTGAIAISREGNISKSGQATVRPELYECPQPIKNMYGNSAYVRCTEHKDISNNKSRYFVYEGVCT